MTPQKGNKWLKRRRKQKKQRRDNLRVLDLGGNDGIRAKLSYPSAEIAVFDKKEGFDVTNNVPSGGWDVILVNHLIEHLIDPDDFLDKCGAAMEDWTILEISTPNMLSWYNRLFMLIGYLPYCYEVSYRHLVGRPPFLPAGGIGGHVRLFSAKALIGLLNKHFFKVLSIRGEGCVYPNRFVQFIDRLFSINPNLAANVRIKCKKI